MSLRATLSGHEVVVEGERGNLLNNWGDCFTPFAMTLQFFEQIHPIQIDRIY